MDMNYSLADIASAVRGGGGRDGDGGGLLGGDGLLVILLFLLMGGGFGGFGGNRGGESTATTAQLDSAINQQTMTSKIDQLAYGMSTAGYENARLANESQMQAASIAAQNQLTLCQGFGGVTAGIAALANQMQQCCCEIKSQLAADKIETLQAKVNEQAAALGNMQQSQYILGQLGKWRGNPPCYDACCGA